MISLNEIISHQLNIAVKTILTYQRNFRFTRPNKVGWLSQNGCPRFVLIGRGDLLSSSSLIILLSSVITATFFGLAFLKSLTFLWDDFGSHTPETIYGSHESPSMSPAYLMHWRLFIIYQHSSSIALALDTSPLRLRRVLLCHSFASQNANCHLFMLLSNHRWLPPLEALLV